MAIENLLLLLAAMLAVAIFLESRLQWLRLPFAAILLLTGFIGSELVVAAGVRIQIDGFTSPTIIYYGFLPLLVFATAFRIDTSTLRGNLAPIGLLSLPMPLITWLVISALVYVGIGHPQGFPWTSALVAGAILTATEPFPLVKKLQASRFSQRIGVLLQAEGVITVALAVILYQLALSMVAAGSRGLSSADLLIQFVWDLVGGGVTGVAVSLIALHLSRRMQSPEHQALVALTTAYLAFLGGEILASASGIVACLIAGWFFGRATRSDFSTEQERFQEQFWLFLSHAAGAIIFLLMGITFTLTLFEERWLAMLIGIVAVAVIRVPQVLTASLAFRFLPGAGPFSKEERQASYVTGLRGALALILALSLPVDLPAWWTIQSIVFGVVFFSLVIQGPIADRLLERLDNKESSTET